MTMRCPMRANMAGELAVCDTRCAWHSDGKCVGPIRVFDCIETAETVARYEDEIEELRARVDELERDNARLSSDELHHRVEIDMLRRNVDARRRIEAQMRALLDGVTLVDEKGEVVS